MTAVVYTISTSFKLKARHVLSLRMFKMFISIFVKYISLSCSCFYSPRKKWEWWSCFVIQLTLWPFSTILQCIKSSFLHWHIAHYLSQKENQREKREKQRGALNLVVALFQLRAIDARVQTRFLCRLSARDGKKERGKKPKTSRSLKTAGKK